MDPNACLSDLLEWLATLGNDLNNGEDSDTIAIDRDAIIERCDNLAEWISKGGFPPCVAAVANMHCNDED